MPPREVRLMKKYPDRILAKLQKQEDMIQEEVKLMQSSVTKNALEPLVEIAGKLANKNVEVIQFNSRANKDFNLVIKAAEAKILDELANSIEDSDYFDISSEVNTEKLTLTVNGEVD